MKITTKTLRRWRRAALIMAAAAPLFQLNGCQMLFGQAGLTTVEAFPNAFINSLGSAFFQTVITALGIGNQLVFQSIFGGS